MSRVTRKKKSSDSKVVIKNDTTKATNVSEFSTEDFSDPQETAITKTVEITINTIENIVREDETSIFFLLEHKDVVLGKSDSFAVKPDFTEPSKVYEIDFTVSLTVTVNDRSSFEDFVSTPLLIKVIENGRDSDDQPGEEDKKRTSESSAKLSPKTTAIGGICNIDLLPIVIGESFYTEKCVLETSQLSHDGTSIPWQNLPVLTVSLKLNDPDFLSPDSDFNFVNITVESIYNAPGIFTQDLEYKAGTIVYIDSDVPESVIFGVGKWTKYRDLGGKKRWASLSLLGNSAKCSRHALSSDWDNVKNPLDKKIYLQKIVAEDAPRIEWNSMNRSLLLENGAHAMLDHIDKYQLWPFQFMTTTTAENDDRTKSKEPPGTKSQFYKCYVDFAELLFPGNTKTRVVAQLYNYNPSGKVEETGLENIIFSPDAQRKGSNFKDIQSEEATEFNSPLTAENGEPVFVIIEVELHRALIPSRISRDYSNLLSELITSTEKRRPYIYSPDLAEEYYSSCVKQLVEVMADSYRDYREELSKRECDPSICGKNSGCGEICQYCFDPESDEVTCFTQYLHKTGVYVAIYSTLQSKVTLLLDQKFDMKFNSLDSLEAQNFVANMYTYLVEQMNIAINEMVEGRYEDNSQNKVKPAKLYFYAEEAYEFKCIEEARNYYQTAICSCKEDPEPWTRYAIFLLKIGDVDRAVEACGNALSLNGRYRLALLLYGGILFEKRQYREAEIFFRTIVEFYPSFIEGWVILHLFYKRTEFYPGVDLTIRIAEKCMKDKPRDTEKSIEESLSFSTIDYSESNVYLLTMCLLFKLHLCDLAGIALAEEMSASGRTFDVLYYLAVHHYLSRRYEDALSHLKEAGRLRGPTYRIASLTGHCYFQEGDFEKAMHHYEFADNVFDKPDELHLVQLRLGIYWEEAGEFERAKKVLLNACKFSPTCRTWLYAGISFYHLDQLNEAELALAEANKIDSDNPDVWGYLCLLNMALLRYEEFSQCYRMAVKVRDVCSALKICRSLYENNLKNVKLWTMISDSMEALNYTPPVRQFPAEKDSTEPSVSSRESKIFEDENVA